MEALKNKEHAKNQNEKNPKTKDGKEVCLQWPKKGTPHVRQDGGRFAPAWAWGYPSPVNLDSIPGWQGHADPHCLLTKCQRKRRQRKAKGKGKQKEKGNSKAEESKEKTNEEAKQQQERLHTLVKIVPEGVNGLKETQEWEEIEMAVDSGATETVVSEEMVKAMEMQLGEAMKRRIRYEVASGASFQT